MTRITRRRGYGSNDAGRIIADSSLLDDIVIDLAIPESNITLPDMLDASVTIADLAFDIFISNQTVRLIEDTNSSEDFGSYIGVIQNLEYTESGERVLDYNPTRRLNLTVENISGKILKYTVELPTIYDTAVRKDIFPAAILAEAEVTDSFVFYVNTFYIPDGNISAAINNWEFIVRENILSLSNDVIYGRDEDDSLSGFGGDDTIIGFEGDDTILGGGHKDLLIGGDDDDSILGGSDDDSLSGDNGNDILKGENGHDLLLGNNNHDQLFGGNGNDTAEGGNGNDLIFGENGHDYLFGNDGTDNIDGGNGRDILSGGNGSDILTGGSGEDTISGNAGNDILTGINPSSTNKGKNEIDTFFGGSGRDRFLLANVSTVFYDDKQSGLGTQDYAQIIDFNPSEDSIQLEGSADEYFLSSNTNTGVSGVAIYYLDEFSGLGGRLRGELIGILENVNIADVSLTDTSQFRYL